MSAEAIAAKIVSHLSEMKDQSQESRLAYYDRLRSSVIQSSDATEAGTSETRKLLEQAIRLAEIEFVPRETNAGGRFALKVATACAGFAGLADFLEPIVDVKTGAMAVSTLVVIATWAGIRFMPKWSNRFRLARNLGLALIVTTAGLFGVQSLFASGAPNGAIAEVFPPAAQLQQQLLAISDTLEGISNKTTEIAENTSDTATSTAETAVNTQKIADNTANIAEGLRPDRVVEAQKILILQELKRFGYDTSEDSLIEALRDHSGALIYYSYLDVPIKLRHLFKTLEQYGHDELFQPDQTIQAAFTYLAADDRRAVKQSFLAAMHTLDSVSVERQKELICNSLDHLDRDDWMIVVFYGLCEESVSQLSNSLRNWSSTFEMVFR